MIDFSLTEEQKHIQHMAKSFAKEHIRPYASQYDEEETFPRVFSYLVQRLLKQANSCW
ncbi:acyl-CoA dehydrogenase family protein [Bacillus atrophaeus]|uniref:acyl-CoA dehydrogenase family protein n=1 Tax=Bacillus atrophaeus TaxID=1452 RepID=UPI000D0309E0|nr:acyl-CoA dehydrogenase family protein [Bacillus atrophaeus]MCY8486346.1 acyl-CoA dehydrogenase family protein [Bacillus atrophaeus]MCY8527185.1 acyl-CoA dehydrogenase family protein [Bacillus atrophaeus]MCY8907678.1 acyl-CoA dehydrogenase family protein [Bacillus atrophaeus]MCY8989780.1 acyl-CoA dehydrogenase family protein [Bacillus atrophaeus]MDL5144194.1 acyl-CoA dehydrogenase family protein [Bacillus atrophaeus]